MTVRKIGFIGTGVMGQPMALNLLSSGVALSVWNRTRSRCEPLEAKGAYVAGSTLEVFERSEAVITMLLNEAAMDAAVGRLDGTLDRVRGKSVVNMGTFSPEYSLALYQDIARAGGRYVEAPVSGSRKPAEEGTLVAMTAGDEGAVVAVTPLLHSMCARVVPCGEVPSALLMKLAVNTFLITQVTGLVEAYHFAQAQGLDTQKLREILDAGPMASSVSKIKLGKLVSQDFDVQASIVDVLKNNDLIVGAAKLAQVASPLVNECRELYAETLRLGHGNLDMMGVLKAFEERTRVGESRSASSRAEST